MDKRTYYKVHIFGVSSAIGLLISIFGVVICQGYSDNKLALYSSLGSLLLFVLLLAGFAIFVIKTKMGKNYWREYVRRRRIKRQREFIDELLDPHYLTNLPKYRGRNSFVLNSQLTAYSLLIITLLPSMMFLLIEIISCDGNIFKLVPSVILTTVILILVLNRNFITKVHVEADGVRFKSLTKEYTIKWSRIKTIGISVNPEGYNIFWSRLYFTTHKQKSPICIMEPRQKKNMINLKFRPEIVHCLLQYWDGEVLNLQTQKKWLKYLKKNGYMD